MTGARPRRTKPRRVRILFFVIMWILRSQMPPIPRSRKTMPLRVTACLRARIGDLPCRQTDPILWLPRALEDGDDCASQRHGVAGRLESRRSTGTRSVAAARLCGTPPHRRPPASGRAGEPHAPADGARSRGLSAARRPAAGRLAEPRALLWRRRADHAQNPGRPRPSPRARANAAMVFRACRSTRRRDVAAPDEMPILALDLRSVAWSRSTRNWPGSWSCARLAD